jgi:sialic acid synthase SpsE
MGVALQQNVEQLRITTGKGPNMAIVIAEFCQNHNGDKHILKEMVWAAAEAGADYAKIQTIYADDLAFREVFESGLTEGEVQKAIKRPYRPEYERLKRLEIQWSDCEWFIEECRKAKIKPLTTVFTRGSVDGVSRLSWDEVKVASYDCASYPLLDDLKSKFKHLFVSTGATFDKEIEKAAQLLAGTSFTFLHCVTIYPTPLDQLHLGRMEYLRQFTPSVGFSDHTLVERDGIKASAVALHLGADVIERHFTVLPSNQTKDGPVSINPGQLKTLSDLAHTTPEARAEYVASAIGDYEQMVGQSRRQLSHTELLNRAYYRGRFATHRADGSMVNNWEEVPLKSLGKGQ